jgi:hypothetical protein
LDHYSCSAKGGATALLKSLSRLAYVLLTSVYKSKQK